MIRGHVVKLKNLERSIARAREVLESGRLTGSSFVSEIEKLLAERTGRNVVVVANATIGLQIMYEVMGVRHVAVCSNTFLATAVAAIRARAEVSLVDSDSLGQMSLQSLEKVASSGSVDGVCVTHIGGFVSPEMAKIARFCHEDGIVLMEDAAQAVGSPGAGTYGEAAVLSFYGSKIVPCGEGGALLFESAERASAARVLRDNGKDPENGQIGLVVGTNARMNEVTAAVLLSQLEALDEILDERRELMAFYASSLRKIGLAVEAAEWIKGSNGYKFPVLMSEPATEVERQMLEAGVELASPVYRIPLHRQPVLAGKIAQCGSMEGTERWCSRHVCLPMYGGVDAEKVVEVFAQVTGRKA